MKIGIIHLSDFHLRKDSIRKLENFDVSKIFSYNNDHLAKVIVIISGDISNSGKAIQFNETKYFIGKMINDIKSKINGYVELLFVPGNHDLEIENDYFDETVLEKYNEENVDEKLNEEIRKMDNFFNFSNKYNLFNKNKLIDIKNIKCNDINIRFVLLNTAPFSSLKHNDKDIHYFPCSFLRNVSHENCDYLFTIMHHSTEWFEEKSKDVLDNFIRKESEIVFVGHEHQDMVVNKVENKSRTIVSKGGTLDAINGCGDFNYLVLDTDTKKIEISCFRIENDKIKKDDQIYNYRLQNKGPLTIDEKILEKIYGNDLFVDRSIDDTFVFPSILARNSKTKDSTINSIENFAEESKSTKVSILKAKSGNGKSTFLKVLHKYYYDNFKYPLLIDLSKEYSIQSIKTIIKRKIEEHYGKESYDEFIQQDIENKILLIDNFDKIHTDNSNKEIFEYLLNAFSQVIISIGSDSWENLENDIKNESKNEYRVYNIQPFVYSKRHELINKVSSVLNIVDEKVIEEKTIDIDTAYNSSKIFICESTDFLCRYIKNVLVGNNVKKSKNENELSYLFRVEISNAIYSNLQNKDQFDDYWDLTKKIAIFMYRNKSAIISTTNLSKIVDELNINYGSKINVLAYTNTLMNSNLLIQINNNYTFSKNIYLAYFISEVVIDNIASGDYELFNKILNEICYGINNDIILFVVYFTHNKKLIESIYDFADYLYSDLEKLNLDSYNINFLNKVKLGYKDFDDRLDKKKHDEKIDKAESRKTNIEVRSLDIFEYDVSTIDDDTNRLKRSYQYAQLLSKFVTVPGNIIDLGYKTKIARSIFEYASKTAYSVLKPLENKFNNLIELLLETDVKENLSKNERIDYFEDILVYWLLMIVLDIYNNLAINLRGSKCKEILKKIEINTVSDRIFNLLILSNGNNLEAFMDLIDDYDNANIAFRKMEREIALEYIASHKLKRNDFDSFSSLLVKKELFTNSLKKEYLKNIITNKDK